MLKNAFWVTVLTLVMVVSLFRLGFWCSQMQLRGIDFSSSSDGALPRKMTWFVSSAVSLMCGYSILIFLGMWSNFVHSGDILVLVL